MAAIVQEVELEREAIDKAGGVRFDDPTPPLMTHKRFRRFEGTFLHRLLSGPPVDKQWLGELCSLDVVTAVAVLSSDGQNLVLVDDSHQRPALWNEIQRRQSLVDSLSVFELRAPGAPLLRIAMHRVQCELYHMLVVLMHPKEIASIPPLLSAAEEALFDGICEVSPQVLPPEMIPALERTARMIEETFPASVTSIPHGFARFRRHAWRAPRPVARPASPAESFSSGGERAFDSDSEEGSVHDVTIKEHSLHEDSDGSRSGGLSGWVEEDAVLPKPKATRVEIKRPTIEARTEEPRKTPFVPPSPRRSIKSPRGTIGHVGPPQPPLSFDGIVPYTGRRAALMMRGVL